MFSYCDGNQTNTDLLGNASAPFINAYAKVANQATNYFAIGHPSAPNYLGIIGARGAGSQLIGWDLIWDAMMKAGDPGRRPSRTIQVYTCAIQRQNGDRVIN
jgi:hypothetical protein